MTHPESLENACFILFIPFVVFEIPGGKLGPVMNKIKLL